LVVIIWINSFTGDSNQDLGKDSEPDGMKVFSKEVASLLISNGAAIKPSIHPDFLSSASAGLSLQQKSPYLKLKGSSELISRKNNRMVIINPKRPFCFVTSGVELSNFAANSDKSFEERTAIALVFIFHNI